MTIGSATVNYPILSNLKEDEATREIMMSRVVLRSALRREVRHFAYPFGDRAAFRRQHVAIVGEAGFASAASAIAGMVEAEGRTDLHALPRISWDGRRTSLRALRVILSEVVPKPVEQMYQRSGLPIQLTIGMAGSTQPRPATT